MHIRPLLLAALVTTAGCKKEPAAVATPPPAPAPAPAPAPVPKDPLAAVPRSDAVLSFLTPREGQCAWMREDPAAHKRAVVASLEGDCQGARFFWSADLGKALVWFDPEHLDSSGVVSPGVSPQGFSGDTPTPGAQSRLYEVTVASGQVRPLPLPTVRGQLSTFGYKGADLVALSVESLTEKQMGQASVQVDGKAIALDKNVEGAPALAFAYRLGPDGTWKRVEVKATGEGSDYAPGASVLETASGLGLDSTTLLDSRLEEHGEEPTADQLAKLQALRPVAQQGQESGEDSSGEWSHVVTPGGSFYVWRFASEFTMSTGHLVLEVGGQLKPVKDLGFTDGDFVAVRTQGPFVLVSADSTGVHPRLYDLRTGERVFHSDSARVATFWPKPSP